MKIKDAIKHEYNIDNPKTKFNKILKKLLLRRAEKEYTSKYFNKCFDEAEQG